MTFQIGDVVVLKSGGPKMTVQYIDRKDGDVYCVWFPKADDEPKRFGFAPETLKM